MPGAKWVEMLLQHVHDLGEHLVRYDGWDNNRARGMRRNSAAEAQPTFIGETPEQVDPDLSRKARAAWALPIKKVDEVDPLACPPCGAKMRMLSVIKDRR